MVFPDHSVLLLETHRGTVVRPIGGHAPPTERRRPTEDDMALLIYTSGTTGKLKGIIYSHAHLMHGSFFMAWQFEMTSKAISMLRLCSSTPQAPRSSPRTSSTATPT